jgi:hypothetical protein
MSILLNLEGPGDSIVEGESFPIIREAGEGRKADFSTPLLTVKL